MDITAERFKRIIAVRVHDSLTINGESCVVTQIELLPNGERHIVLNRHHWLLIIDLQHLRVNLVKTLHSSIAGWQQTYWKPVPLESLEWDGSNLMND